MKRILSIVVLGLVVASAALAARSDFPQPKALEPDVTFWKRIYSEVGTDGGLIHDTHDLSLVYEVVKLPSRNGADRYTEARKSYYQSILRSLAAGKRSGLSSDEKRVLALFGRDDSSARLRLASERIRFQLGQADKFRAGIIRSGAYKAHIIDILRDMGLPLEIANLPHVESSFTPNIYSRVGAAGLWQFTSGTGRRFMQVDSIVDERLDPYRASLAAARLLDQNYRVTGSWPLAITAYNHGASGMRRAAQLLGTKDIARIVREYNSRSFGFASRNFYVEFLAANHVASNHEDYFGKLALDQPVDFDSVTLPFYARSRDLAAALGIDASTLEKANPALRPGVWRNTNFVPRGYKLHVPTASLERPLAEALASIPSGNRYASQSTSGSYTVRRGDTLSKIASRNGISSRQLASLNGLRNSHSIRVGQRLRLPSRNTIAPMEPAEREVSVATAAPEKQEIARVEPAPARPIEIAVSAPEPESPPALVEDDTSETVTTSYTVRRGDNLTRIAHAHGITVAQLAAQNGLGSRGQIKAGQKLRIVREAASPAVPEPSAAPEIQVAKVEPRPEPRTEKPPTPAPSKPSAAPAPPTPKVASPALPPAAKPPVHQPTRAAAPEVAIADASTATPSDAPATDVADGWDAKEESATDPSPGLLADPSDYTIGRDRMIVVQPNETLGHYAEWLGVRASRLRQLNGMRFGEPVVLHQKLKLDFSQVPPGDFERVRTEYHRELQEEFFTQWEIEGTSIRKIGPGESIWKLSTREFEVPIWLLRQYNPDVDLDSLSAGTQITVPKLRQRSAETSARDVADHGATAG